MKNNLHFIAPTEKSDSIEDSIEQIFGINRRKSILERTCTTCNNDVLGFRDALSEKEFAISGMCQKCQDSVFDS